MACNTLSIQTQQSH